MTVRKDDYLVNYLSGECSVDMQAGRSEDPGYIMELISAGVKSTD